MSTIHPHWKVVAIDETHCWTPVIVTKTGRLWGLYLFDANRHVHCCELTPSYEMWFVETVTERQISDELDGDIRTWSQEADEGCSYFHCSDIDRMDPGWFCDLGETPLEEDQIYDEAQSAMYEEVQCNSRCPKNVLQY